MSRDWLDTIHDSCRRISIEARKLEHLARAFQRAGNIPASEELFETSEVLSTAAEDILRAVGKYLSDQVGESQKEFALTIQAASGKETK